MSRMHEKSLRRCLLHSLAVDAGRERVNVTKLHQNVGTAKGLSPLHRNTRESRDSRSNKNSRMCEYPRASWSSTARGASVLLCASRQGVQQQSFPPTFFLDIDIFCQAQLELPPPSLIVPLYVSDLLGGEGKVRQMTVAFFSNIYPCMPFIPTTWAHKRLLSPLSPIHADSTLLLLSMYLINWIPSPSVDPKTAIYTTAKQLFVEQEIEGSLSLRAIQAGLLIGLYELGHCIYPAPSNPPQPRAVWHEVIVVRVSSGVLEHQWIDVPLQTFIPGEDE